MTEFRSFDGYGNNLANPNWGRAESNLFRHPGLAGYSGDGQSPAGLDRPHPRDISNAVCAQVGDGTPSRAGLSDYVWAWGQFLDHELDITGPAEPAESMEIVVRAGSHPKLTDRDGVIPVSRSRFDPSTGTDSSNPRQQINEQSSFVDGSNVYGANHDRASVLRAGSDGKLKASDLKDHKRALLPRNTFGLTNDTGPARPDVKPDDFFAAGDIRANEHVVLTSLHTLFLREHNRLCDELKRDLSGELASLAPHARDERLFQEARRRVIAEMQVITYQEFLPALLGPDGLTPYAGYRTTVNPSVSNLFAHAAYRLGHSMVSPVIQRISPTKSPTVEPLPLEEAFWSPLSVDADLVDQLLNGLWQQRMQEIDPRTVDGLRNHLFRSQISGQPDRVLDLAALNIQRGRDHGFPSYNECRAALGLSRKKSFEAISSERATSWALQKVYDDNINLVDVWIGGLAEDHLPGAQVGELISHVLREQFERLRDGDRLWFEAPDAGFTAEQIAALKSRTLADIVRDNSNAKPTSNDVFHVS